MGHDLKSLDASRIWSSTLPRRSTTIDGGKVTPLGHSGSPARRRPCLYFSRNAPDNHFCRDRSRDARSTPLSPTVRNSSSAMSPLWGSESVGRGLDSTTLFGRGVFSRAGATTAGVGSFTGVASLGVGGFVDVLCRFVLLDVRPEALLFSAMLLSNSHLLMSRKSCRLGVTSTRHVSYMKYEVVVMCFQCVHGIPVLALNSDMPAENILVHPSNVSLQPTSTKC